MSTIVIGLGNPVLTDDSVGIHAARALSSHLRGRTDITVCELSCGGLELMEAMVGYKRAIVVDAAVTGKVKPGTVFLVRPEDLCQSRNSASIHNASIKVALELGTHAGLALPNNIRFWAVEAENVTTFSEQMTETVKNALPTIIRKVLCDIKENTATHTEKSL